MKQEKQERAQPTQAHNQLNLPHLSGTTVDKPVGDLTTSLRNTQQKRDTAALNALSSMDSERATTTVPPQRPIQHFPAQAGFMTPHVQAPPRNFLTPLSVQNQQVQDPSKLSVNCAFLPADTKPFPLRQPTGGNPHYARPATSESKSNDGLARRNNDGDTDMEDRPLGTKHNACLCELRFADRYKNSHSRYTGSTKATRGNHFQERQRERRLAST